MSDEMNEFYEQTPHNNSFINASPSQLLISPLASEPAGKKAKFQNVKSAHNEIDIITSTPSTTICIITRQDLKPLPFNFYNSAVKSWQILQTLDPNSLEHNQKGIVIKGTVNSNMIDKATDSPREHILNGIVFNIKIPRERSPFMGEVVFNLTKIDDRSLLTLSDSELKQQI